MPSLRIDINIKSKQESHHMFVYNIIFEDYHILIMFIDL